MFKSKAYISGQAQGQDLDCTICYQPSADVVRCSGPCHKIFCLKCVSRSRFKEGPCPNRCSLIFQVEPIHGHHFVFQCPYRQNGCQHISESELEFEGHYQACGFINEQCKTELSHIREYECPLGHRLTFLTEEAISKIYGKSNFYYIFMNQRCSYCHDVTLCRSICLQCSTQDQKACFCTKCRKLPCTKTLCPIGHQLKVRQGFSYTLTCDFCGLSGLIFGDMAYEDTHCNFDICLRCFQKLNETHPLIPLHNNIPQEKTLAQQTL